MARVPDQPPGWSDAQRWAEFGLITAEQLETVRRQQARPRESTRYTGATLAHYLGILAFLLGLGNFGAAAGISCALMAVGIIMLVGRGVLWGGLSIYAPKL